MQNEQESQIYIEEINRLKLEEVINLVKQMGFNFASINKGEVVYLKNDLSKGQTPDIVALDSDLFRKILAGIIKNHPHTKAEDLITIIDPETERRKELEQATREAV